MPNKNYRKGAGFESRFIAKLIKDKVAVRSGRFYASRGITDVFWVDMDGKYHEAQLKYSSTKPYISPKERQQVTQYASKYGQITVWIVLKSYRKKAIWEKIS